jgi:hypothetical protein
MSNTFEPSRTIHEPIHTYPLKSDESLVNALINALSEEPINQNPAEREPLHNWINCDALETAISSACPELHIATIVWDHRVVITSDSVEVYEPVAS